MAKLVPRIVQQYCFTNSQNILTHTNVFMVLKNSFAGHAYLKRAVKKYAS